MVKLKDIISKLSVLDENILVEAARQPVLYLNASRYRVQKMRERTRAEATIESFMAERNLMIRAKAKQLGDRITDSAVKANILKNPQFKLMQAVLTEAEAKEEFSKLLLEVCRMRRDAIRILADAQSYEATKETMDLERQNQHRRLSNKAREVQQRRRQLASD